MHPPKNAVAREPLLSAEPRLAYYLERLCSRRSNRSTASLRSSRWGRKRTRLDSTFFETRGRRRYLYWLCCGPLSYRLSFMQLSNTCRWVPRSAKRIWTFFLLQGDSPGRNVSMKHNYPDYRQCYFFRRQWKWPAR